MHGSIALRIGLKDDSGSLSMATRYGLPCRLKIASMNLPFLPALNLQLFCEIIAPPIQSLADFCSRQDFTADQPIVEGAPGDAHLATDVGRQHQLVVGLLGFAGGDFHVQHSSVVCGVLYRDRVLAAVSIPSQSHTNPIRRVLNFASPCIKLRRAAMLSL